MKETRFKDTEIGRIPEDWNLALLGDITKFLSNNTFSRDKLHVDGGKGEIKNIHYGDVLVKYGSILDVSRTKIPTIDSGKIASFCPENLAQDGDVIIADTAEDDTVCKVTELWNIGDSKVVSGLHTMWCRPDCNTFAVKYLGHFMNSVFYHIQILPLIQGIKVSSVSKNSIKDTWVCIPPLSEQTRIASALTGIDNLISSLDKLIEKKKAIKEGTMQQLLTGKKRLKGFNEPWVMITLGEICEFRNGYTPSKRVKSFWDNGTIPWFRMEDIRDNGRILSNSIQHVTPNAIKGELFSSNSIILSTTATIGEHALLIADSLANQQFTNLKIRKSLVNRIDIMWFYWYCFIIGEWCRHNIHEGGLAAVNISDLSKLGIVIPSIEEQKKIASILSSMDNQIAFLEAKRNKYIKTKQGMIQQLLTGRIRLV